MIFRCERDDSEPWRDGDDTGLACIDCGYITPFWHILATQEPEGQWMAIVECANPATDALHRRMCRKEWALTGLLAQLAVRNGARKISAGDFYLCHGEFLGLRPKSG